MLNSLKKKRHLKLNEIRRQKYESKHGSKIIDQRKKNTSPNIINKKKDMTFNNLFFYELDAIKYNKPEIMPSNSFKTNYLLPKKNSFIYHKKKPSDKLKTLYSSSSLSDFVDFSKSFKHIQEKERISKNKASNTDYINESKKTVAIERKYKDDPIRKIIYNQKDIINKKYKFLNNNMSTDYNSLQNAVSTIEKWWLKINNKKINKKNRYQNLFRNKSLIDDKMAAADNTMSNYENKIKIINTTDFNAKTKSLLSQSSFINRQKIDMKKSDTNNILKHKIKNKIKNRLKSENTLSIEQQKTKMNSSSTVTVNDKINSTTFNTNNYSEYTNKLIDQKINSKVSDMKKIILENNYNQKNEKSFGTNYKKSKIKIRDNQNKKEDYRSHSIPHLKKQLKILTSFKKENKQQKINLQSHINNIYRLRNKNNSNNRNIVKTIEKITMDLKKQKIQENNKFKNDLKKIFTAEKKCPRRKMKYNYTIEANKMRQIINKKILPNNNKILFLRNENVNNMKINENRSIDIIKKLTEDTPLQISKIPHPFIAKNRKKNKTDIFNKTKTIISKKINNEPINKEINNFDLIDLNDETYLINRIIPEKVFNPNTLRNISIDSSTKPIVEDLPLEIFSKRIENKQIKEMKEKTENKDIKEIETMITNTKEINDNECNTKLSLPMKNRSISCDISKECNDISSIKEKKTNDFDTNIISNNANNAIDGILDSDEIRINDHKLLRENPDISSTISVHDSDFNDIVAFRNVNLKITKKQNTKKISKITKVK